jgi:hypothetical protein
MIWSFLKAIGGCTTDATTGAAVDIPEDLIEYIKTTYPDPPADNKIITVSVPVIKLKAEIGKLQKIFDSRFPEFRAKYGNVDFKQAKKAEDPVLEKLQSDLLAVVPEGFYSGLGKLLTTQIVDYTQDRAFMMLRGEATGFSVFKSTTHYAKGKPKEGIADLPLWKIKLQTEGWNTETIQEFMALVPNNSETNAIDWEAGGSTLLKYVMSEILRLAINATFASPSFKLKFYHVCFLLDGKWPHEYPELVEYYISQITSEQEGMCMICGQSGVTVEKLPMKQVGFFTDDQWSTNLKFNTGIPVACKGCVTDVKKGFTFVKKNLRFFIAGRGKNKNPFEMYLLPYSTDLALLKRVLDDIARIRNGQDASVAKKDAGGGAVQRARVVAVLEKETTASQIAPPNAPSKKKEKGKDAGIRRPSLMASFEMAVQGGAQDGADAEEGADYIEALLRPSTLDDETVRCLTYMVVLFTHPEGNASAFHNVLDAILADGVALKKLGAKIYQVTEKYKVKPGILKGLSHVVGEFYYPKFLADLLRMTPVDRELFYRNAYSETKQGFMQSIKTIGREGAALAQGIKEGQWTSRNMFVLEITNSLMEALDLWEK